jgi:hypothetical protein
LRGVKNKKTRNVFEILKLDIVPSGACFFSFGAGKISLQGEAFGPIVYMYLYVLLFLGNILDVKDENY